MLFVWHTLKRLHYLALAMGVLVACALLAGSHTPTALERVLESGQLVMLSRNGPTTYYEGPHGLDGVEYNLGREFADSLGVELVIREIEHLGSLLQAVDRGTGQLGAAGLTATEHRQRQVRFTLPYMHVTQQLIYRAGQRRPRSMEELVGKTILVISDSAHVETLRELQKELPDLRWHEQSNIEMVELIEMVHTGQIDLTIVDSNAYDLNRTLYPMARVAMELKDPEPLSWAFPKGKDNSLFDLANEFLARAEASGAIAAILDRHYGKFNTLDRGSALTFARRLETRLPQWQEHLQAAAEETDLDWQLLAAISYQESHWNPRARSHTGVRGMMMLTQTTAREMGIKNRLDPEQSISGGARYFRKTLDRLPDSILGKDRIWMALAAYNVGYGHLQDARVLTEREGDNPDKWEDVEKYLPLLAKRKYYRSVKHGYARGWEPVAYVRNIRSYFNTIAWHQQIKQSKLASSREEPPDPARISNPLSEQASTESGSTLL